MPFLHKFILGGEIGKTLLMAGGELGGIIYHDIFDFPLTSSEVIKWTVGKKGLTDIKKIGEVVEENGYYFLKGKAGLVYKRLLRERISERKLKIARRAAGVLRLLKTVKMVAVSGALAMKNTVDEGDIDLLIITQKNRLWTTRLKVYVLLKLFGFRIRKAGNNDQKDKLCLNLWLDEQSLAWPETDRNLFTAHEITQIEPLVNKNKTYERFLTKNVWLKDYWPNAIKMNYELRTMNKAKNEKSIVHIASFIVQLVEKLAFKLQYAYMEKKITREKVGLHRAVFHPHNWGEIILGQLAS